MTKADLYAIDALKLPEGFSLHLLKGAWTDSDGYQIKYDLPAGLPVVVKDGKGWVVCDGERLHAYGEVFPAKLNFDDGRAIRIEGECGFYPAAGEMQRVGLAA